MRGPGVIDLGAVGDQPAADHRLGETRAIFAGGGGGQVAKPGEALQLLGHRAHGAKRGEVHVGEGDGLAPDREPAGEDGVAALAVALHMVAGNRGQLEWLARAFQPRKERAARELSDNVAIGPSRRCSSAAQRLDVGGISAGAAAEGGGSGDQHIGAGIHRRARRLGVDPAVDLDVDREPLLGDAVGDRPRSS